MKNEKVAKRRVIGLAGPCFAKYFKLHFAVHHQWLIYLVYSHVVHVDQGKYGDTGTFIFEVTMEFQHLDKAEGDK